MPTSRSFSPSLAKVLSLTVACAAAVSACGGSSTSTFGGGPGSQGGNGNGSGDTAPGGGFNDNQVTTTAACVTGLGAADLAPANLVIMYDKSGSMGNPAEYGDPAKKWNPLLAGMKAFLSDPASSTMDASLQFFPQSGSVDQICAADYATPLVKMSPLTDATPFVNAIQAATPHGGTPTLPALTGAINYAHGVAASAPDARTVVVLITDGAPGFTVNGAVVPGCTDNDIDHVSQAAKAAFEGKPSIPTYVIGVGTDLVPLNAVAAAGGTGQAFLLSWDDPTSTTKAFQGALDAIRTKSLACDGPLPAPPAGLTLDVSHVNVVLVDAAGKEHPIGYSQDCAVPNAWRYDDVAHPQRIQLCSAACTEAQSSRGGKLTIAFGCQTVPAVK